MSQCVVCNGGVLLSVYSFPCRWVLEQWLWEPTATARSASAPGRWRREVIRVMVRKGMTEMKMVLNILMMLKTMIIVTVFVMIMMT